MIPIKKEKQCFIFLFCFGPDVRHSWCSWISHLPDKPLVVGSKPEGRQHWCICHNTNYTLKMFVLRPIKIREALESFA